MSIARKSAFGFASQTYMMLVGLVMTIVVARLLGPEGKGVIAVMGAMIAFSVGLASLGLAGAFGFLAGKERFPRPDLFWSMLSWSVLLGVVVSLVIWLLQDALLASVLKGLTTVELLAVMISLPSTYFNAFVTQAYVGYGRVVILAVLQSATATLNLILILISTFVFHAGTTGAVLALSASTVVASAVYAIAFGGVGALSFSRVRAVTADALPYGLKGYVGGATNMFSLRADVFFLNFFAGPAVVGIYSVATNLAEKIWLLSTPIGAAVYSQIAGSNKADAARITCTTARANLVMGLFASLGMLALSVPLIPIIYGQQFAPATLYLAFLLPGTVALAVAGAFYTYWVAHLGQPGVTSAIAVASAAASAFLYVALIPSLGAVGAAIGSTGSYSLSLVAYGFLFPRETGTSLQDMYVPNRSDWALYGSIVKRMAGRFR